MSHFDEIYEIAADNYGLVTAAQAGEAGVVGAELNRYVADGRLSRIGHGLYKLVRWIPTDNDAYAEAVAHGGEGACLYGEAVLAMHGLALASPARITVAVPKRTRRKVPAWVELVEPPEPVHAVSDMGIPAQRIADAIRTCRKRIMPDRLADAADQARAEGLISRSEHETLKEEIDAT